MSYSIEWDSIALQQLARIWTDSTEKRAVTSSVDQIDKVLAHEPNESGEDYFGDRLLIASPLWSLYRVDLKNPSVTILQVGVFGVDLPHENLPPSA